MAAVLAAAIAVVVASAVAPTRRFTFDASPHVVAAVHTLDRPNWSPSRAWPSTGAVVITGRLRNQGPQPSNLVRVVVTLTDAAGNPVRSAVGFPAPWSIAAGQEVPFIVPTFPDARIASYRIRVEEARPAAPTLPF